MNEFLTPEVLALITTILSFVVGFVARQPAYQKAKGLVTSSKQFLTEIDDALYDSKVTDEEFRKIFDAGKKIIDTSRGS